MKTSTRLTKAVDVSDSIAVKAFKMDYIYLNEDGFTVHFEPNIIPPQTFKYEEMAKEYCAGIGSAFITIAALSASQLTATKAEPTTEAAAESGILLVPSKE